MFFHLIGEDEKKCKQARSEKLRARGKASKNTNIGGRKTRFRRGSDVK